MEPMLNFESLMENINASPLDAPGKVTLLTTITKSCLLYTSLVSAALAGVLVDKLKSATKFLTRALILLIVAMAAFTITPAGNHMAVVSIIIGFAASFVIYMMRGTYFVPMTELDIPNEYIGTAAGIVSFIGFLPDAFMFTVFGKMMGDNPGAAEYKAIFWVCVALAVVGLLLTYGTQILIRKAKKAH